MQDEPDSLLVERADTALWASLRELEGGARLETPGHADQGVLTALLDGALRASSPHSTAEDLPLLVGPSACSLRRIVRLKGQPISHAALYIHAYHLRDRPLRVGVIGAVATDPRHRGRGWAGLLLQDLLSRLPALEVSLAVLWSQVPGYYERFGFERGGRELIHILPGSFHRPCPEGIVVRHATWRDLPALQALHAKELSATCRSQAEWEAYLSLPETRFFLLQEGEAARAYGVVGKGADLQDCLHEWGGAEQFLPLLVSAILRQQPRERLFLMSPPWKREAAALLRQLGAEEHLGALGMIYIPRPEELLRALSLPGLEEPRSKQPASLVATLFGSPRAEPEASTEPLPFYLYGLDSM